MLPRIFCSNQSIVREGHEPGNVDTARVGIVRNCEGGANRRNGEKDLWGVIEMIWYRKVVMGNGVTDWPSGACGRHWWPSFAVRPLTLSTVLHRKLEWLLYLIVSSLFIITAAIILYYRILSYLTSDLHLAFGQVFSCVSSYLSEKSAK